jgi:hypothetical protein
MECARAFFLGGDKDIKDASEEFRNWSQERVSFVQNQM